MKANHNTDHNDFDYINVVLNIFKEQIESKSQRTMLFQLQNAIVVLNIFKEQIESKSQRSNDILLIGNVVLNIFKEQIESKSQHYHAKYPNIY